MRNKKKKKNGRTPVFWQGFLSGNFRHWTKVQYAQWAEILRYCGTSLGFELEFFFSSSLTSVEKHRRYESLKDKGFIFTREGEYSSSEWEVTYLFRDITNPIEFVKEFYGVFDILRNHDVPTHCSWHWNWIQTVPVKSVSYGVLTRPCKEIDPALSEYRLVPIPGCSTFSHTDFQGSQELYKDTHAYRIRIEEKHFSGVVYPEEMMLQIVSYLLLVKAEMKCKYMALNRPELYTKKKLEFFVNSKKSCFEYYKQHGWGGAADDLLNNKDQESNSRVKVLKAACVYYDLFLKEMYQMPLFDWALNQKPNRLMSISTYDVLALWLNTLTIEADSGKYLLKLYHFK